MPRPTREMQSPFQVALQSLPNGQGPQGGAFLSSLAPPLIQEETKRKEKSSDLKMHYSPLAHT